MLVYPFQVPVFSETLVPILEVRTAEIALLYAQRRCAGFPGTSQSGWLLKCNIKIQINHKLGKINSFCSLRILFYFDFWNSIKIKLHPRKEWILFLLWGSWACSHKRILHVFDHYTRIWWEQHLFLEKREKYTIDRNFIIIFSNHSFEWKYHPTDFFFASRRDFNIIKLNKNGNISEFRILYTRIPE